MHSEVRVPIPASPGQLAKRDNEYKREGVANIFAVVELKAGRHFTCVTANRKADQFALPVRDLVFRVSFARTIHLVIDNLNTHCRKSLVDHLGEPQGQYLESPHGSLHPETRQLAQPGRN